jgi:diamine N-acetyltransferase
MTVSLREITDDTLYDISQLKVAENQTDYVAPNLYSLAQALFYPEADYRGIYSNDQLVGFLMLYDETKREVVPEKPEVDVWRFMIDEKHQKKGIGKQVLKMIIEELKDKQCFEFVKLSYVPGNDSAVELYKAVGFKETGELDDGEVVMKYSF